MTPTVKFRLLAHKQGLKQAPQILQRNLTGGMKAMGARLVTASRSRMRKDTGQAQKSISYRISVAGLNMNLIVFSTLVQAFVDAYGLKRGVFPNFRINSSLHNWVKRRIKSGQLKEAVRPAGPVPTKRKAGGRKLRQIKRLKGTVRIRAASSQQRSRAKGSNHHRLTFLVARAIYRHGIRASNWNREALKANRNMIIRELKNAIHRSANELRRVA